jgi:hypothetical protein
MFKEKSAIIKASMEAICASSVSVKPEKEFVTSVLNASEDVVRLAWGETEYYRFMDFLNHIDVSHPDINLILTLDEKKILLDAIKIQSFCCQEKCHIGDGIFRLIPSEIRAKLRKFVNPMENRYQVRMLLHPEDRKFARSFKSVRMVEMDSFLKKGESFWRNHPSSFKTCVRNSDMFSGDVDKAKQKAEHYMRLGCLSLCEEINKSIEIFQKQIGEDYLGFHRINLTSAAIILAKTHDFSLEVNLGKCAAIIEKGKIPGFDFGGWGETSPILIQKYQYEPRVYPWHQIEDIASERIKHVIGKLDSFPDCDGKPIFDHFMALVPSIKWPGGNFPWFSVNGGKNKVFPNVEKARNELDFEMVRLGYIVPILLGERDGRCYFITCWD